MHAFHHTLQKLKCDIHTKLPWSLESSKIEFGMILVVIWYKHHTSVFAVYDGMHASIVETGA